MGQVFEELSCFFGDREWETTAYEVRFWSTYQWFGTWLFGQSVRLTEASVLREELEEAHRRSVNVHARLTKISALPLTQH